MASRTERTRRAGWIATTCTLDCPDACALECRVEGGRIVAVGGRRDHPYTQGFTCAKIRRHPRRLVSAERLRHPLVREGGRLVETDWERAMELVAERLGRCLSRGRPILHVRGGANKGAAKVAEDGFFAALGAWHVRSDACCDLTGIAAFVEDFGVLEMGDPRMLADAERIVVWGRRLRASTVHMAAWVSRARRGGATVASISPRAGENAGLASRHVAIRPGTDRLLARALTARLLAGSPGMAEVATGMRDGAAFLRRIAEVDVAACLARCAVSEEDFAFLLSLYGGDGPCATVVGNGLQRCGHGGASLRAVDALAWISGNVGVPGGGIYFSTPSGRAFDRSWVRPERYGRELPLGRLGRAVAEAEPGPAFMWISQGNPVNQLSEGGRLADAMGAEEPFVVVVDAFLTDTARRADCVLPCRLLFEEDDVVGAWGHHAVGRVRAVVPAPEGCRGDGEILGDLARRIGRPEAFLCPEEALDASLRGGLLAMSLAELDGRDWAVAPHEAVPFAGGRTGHDDGLFHPDLAFDPLETGADPPVCPSFRLLSVIRRAHLHSQILEEEQEGLEPEAFLAPASLRRLGAVDGSPGRIVSPLGAMDVRLRVEDGLDETAVLVERGPWAAHGWRTNWIVEGHDTDRPPGVAYYDQIVRVDVAEPDGKERGSR